MPLDHAKGEIIGDLGTDYVVAPFLRYAGTPLHWDAMRHAVAAFQAAGALLPITFEPDDVLIQEYPRHNKLAFVFQRRIAGKEHLYPFVFDMPPKMVAELKNLGKWGHVH